jgi:TonB-linked SusC/RagA family outer membrane protein
MKKLYTLIFLMGFMNILFAQSQTVEGTLISSEDNLPMIGASIMVKGTTKGTVTDFEGKYELQDLSAADVLVYSYTGHRDIEVIVGNQSIIDLTMDPDSEVLDEVVVIGYGVQKKKVSTGSISRLDSKQIEGYQVQNVQSALEGQVSGLIVSESSGQPGSAKSVLIRGVGTNGDNNPLYIIDGLQVNNIDNLNPSDIATVDVLKDAASTSIYGSRAANGVVIITTKKGDGANSISYEGFLSTSVPWRLPETLGADDYVTLTREKFANANQTEALNSLGFPNIGDDLINTNWNNALFSPAPLRSHKLSANAGNLYLSLEYWDQNGTVGGDKSNYKRYSARMNGSKEITPFLSIGENLYINRVENQNLGQNNAFGSVISDALVYDPITPVFDDNAQYGFAQSEWVQKEYINPLSRIFLANNSGHSDQILGNVYLEVKPIEKLRIRTDFGIDYLWFNFRTFTPDFEFHPAAFNLSNDVAQGYGFFQTYQWENYANYTDSFGKHNFDLIVGTTYRESESENASGSTSFIPQEVQFDDNFQIIDAGQDTIDLAEGSIGVVTKLSSVFGRLLYDFDGKYLFSATMRRDGSSKFGANNRFGIFPSLSAGWVMSSEPFFDAGPINFLKLRASWGVNGNDRIRDLTFAARVENVFAYPFGGSLETGSALATPPNPNIKWEESVQFDFGVEVRMWDDALSAEFDVYSKTTKDLLANQTIPGFIGATNSPVTNLGEVQNTGVEAAINYRFNVGDVKVQTSINYTHFVNEVTAVAGDVNFVNGWNWPVRNQAITRFEEGFPVAHFVGYQTNGIFQDEGDVFSYINSSGDLLQPNAEPGDLRFVDVNGDGIIDTEDITNIGSPWPDHIVGFTLSAQYKGFDINAVLGTQIGHDIYRAYERSDVTFTNYQTFWLDRWTPDNPSNELPRLVSTDPNNNQRPSDFYVEDGTFLRLRNFQLGYSVPTRVLEKIKMKGARIYFSANNLFTLTNYRGFDPEIGINAEVGQAGNVLDSGIDKGFYPSNKVFGGGLKITL